MEADAGSTAKTHYSLEWYFLKLAHDGTPLGDTTWIVLDDDYTEATTSTSYTNNDLSSVFDNDSSTDGYRYWIDLSGDIEPCFGLKHGIKNYDATTKQVQFILHIVQIR